MRDDRTTERRRTPRKRTLKSARIVFNNRHSVVDCTVRNLSTSGALLILPTVVGIPDGFEVCMDGSFRAAHVMWKSDRSLGVAWDD